MNNERLANAEAGKQYDKAHMNFVRGKVQEEAQN